MSSKELTVGQSSQYVGPYRLEKTLGKGQTGKAGHPQCLSFWFHVQNIVFYECDHG